MFYRWWYLPIKEREIMAEKKKVEKKVEKKTKAPAKGKKPAAKKK